MKIQAVREKAKILDLKPGKMMKANLISAIQSKEGHFTCFDTGRNFCDQTECCWKGDYLP